MRIGITGPHRSGKTTLARALAEHYGIEFLTSVAGGAVRDHGFDMVNGNRLTPAGIDMQDDLMSRILMQAHNAGPSFVADRTPLDAAAYLMADATANAGDRETRQRAVWYMEYSMKETSSLYDIVFVLPPAIPFEEEDGKAPDNDAYTEHFHLLIQGMLAESPDPINAFVIPRDNVLLLDRINSAITTIDDELGAE
jgi:nicotinamide riboside kinase